MTADLSNVDALIECFKALIAMATADVQGLAIAREAGALAAVLAALNAHRDCVDVQ